jgi:hypothetical protein
VDLSPKSLEEGWIKRTLLNAYRLSIRSPGWWFVLYVGFPVFTFYTPNIVIQCFLMGVSLIVGTFLAFKCDHLEKCNFSNFMAVLIRSPQPIIILCVTLGVLFEVTHDLPIKEKSLLNSYFSYGINIFFLMLSSIFASIYISLFWDIPYTGWKLFKNRKKTNLELEEEFSGHTISGSVSIFGLHLVVDTDLVWQEACSKSREALHSSNMGKGFFVIATIPIFVVICPIFLGLSVPWVYCIYRELFWGTGITEKKKIKAPKLAVAMH